MTTTVQLYEGLKAAIPLINNLTGWSITMGPTILRTDKLLILSPYGVGGDETETGEFTKGVQFRFLGPNSGGAKPVLDAQEQIFQQFNDLRDSTLSSGFHIVRAWRQSDAPPGLDGQRVEIFDNYYFRSDRLGRAG